VLRYRPYRCHEAVPLVPSGDGGLAIHALTMRVLELVNERLKSGLQAVTAALTPSGESDAPPLTLDAFHHALEHLAKLEDAEQLTDLVSATLLQDAHQRQVILETARLEDRLRYLVQFLQGAGSGSDTPSLS
jgi:ATP-dependent Lon protease